MLAIFNVLGKYISSKRKATWGWQDKLLMPQTPTSYNERHSKGCGYLKWSGKRWAKRAHKYYSKYIALQDPQKAICYVFGSYCDQALAVSWCEGRHYVHAHTMDSISVCSRWAVTERGVRTW